MNRLNILFVCIFAAATFCFTIHFAGRPDSFYRSGNKINFAITSETGARSYSVVNIQDLTSAGGATNSIFAQDQRLDDQRKTTFTYRLIFYADSLHWAVDALNHLNIPVAYSSNYIIDLKSDSLVYPYNMKVGDTLMPASGSEFMSGGVKNERHVRFLNRKVTAFENVSIGGETIQVFRIECKMISQSIADYGQLGKIPTEFNYTFTEWFSPVYGVVKSERKSKDGVQAHVLQSLH